MIEARLRPAILAAVAVAVALGGCASISQVDRTIADSARQADAVRLLTERNSSSGAVIRTSRPRISGEEIILKTSILPSRFDEPASYVTRGTQSVVQALEDIAISSGMAVRSSEIAGALGATSTPGTRESLSGNISLEYNGTLRGLLDEIASRAEVSWRYNPGAKAVEFFRYETRTLAVNVPAGVKSMASSVSLAGVTGSGGGSGAGAGNVAVSQSLNIDPWASITDGVRSILAEGRASQMLSGGGAVGGAGAAGGKPGTGGMDGTVVANPELGLLTVTARPQVLDRINRYVSSINQRFAKNILIDVKIMSVTLNEENSAGFSASLLYSRIGKLGGALAGPAPLQAGMGSPGVLTLGPNNPNSPWNGSALVAQALSQFGRVALQKQGQVLAVNGQPSPLQVANEITYVASSATTQAPNVGSTTTQTPGTKVVGFTANFLPLVLGDNRILLSYQIQLSSLAAPLTPNAQGVQTPNIASQSLPGQAFVRDGQAIVLFGYDEQRDGLDAATHLAGASKAATTNRQLMVIVVQVSTGHKHEYE